MRRLSAACTVALCLIAAVSAFAADPSSRVRELQQALKELGYDPAPADGRIGQKTRDAIRAYQKDAKQEPDGKYSGILLFGLQQKLREAREAATPDGQKRATERNKLQALSNEELTKLIARSDKKEAERIANLIGERLMELPAKILMEVFGASGTALTNLITSMSLQALFYPAGQEGIRLFQEDIGARVTGVLTLGQFQELSRRRTRFRDTPIYLSGWGNTKIFAYDRFASVEGTWTIVDDKIAYPINTAKIECHRDRRECQNFQASVIVPKFDKGDDAYNVNLHVSTYKIISWDRNEIVASGSGTCRTTLLTLNLNSHEVFETTRNNVTKECLENPLTLPALDKPRVSKLVPGWDLSYKFWEDRRKRASEFINSRVRKELKSLEQQLKSQKK